MKGKLPDSLAIFVLPVFIALALGSCEECYKCGIAQPEPYFNVKFRNEDSLADVMQKSAELDELKIKFEDTLDLKEDSLNWKLDSLETEQDPLKIIKLENAIDTLEADIETLEAKIVAARANRTLLDKARRKLISGEIALQSITSPGGETVIFNADSSSDSANVYRFPLSMNADTSKYIITIKDYKKDSVKTLKVFYRRQTVTKDGSVLVKAEGLGVSKPPEFYEDFKRPDSLAYYFEDVELKPTDETIVYLFF